MNEHANIEDFKKVVDVFLDSLGDKELSYDINGDLKKLSEKLDLVINQKKPVIDKDLLDDIIEDLQGSCNSLHDVCENHNITESDLTIAHAEYIDEQIFHCSTCSWWYESGSQDDEGNCEDCQKEEGKE